MKAGDLLHIKGQHDDGTISTWYAELVGIDEDGMLEIFYLEPTKLCQGYIWSYKSDWTTVSPQTVIRSFTPTKETYLSTLHSFGFHATVEENQFLKVDVDIPKSITVPMMLDSDTDSVHEGDEDMSDFIVDDDVANEPFTHAPATSSFVQDTHKAVNDYNKWVPKNRSESRVKSFIDDMEQRYRMDDDNRHFARGEHVDYLHPKLAE